MKVVTAAFSILMICSLLLLNVKIAKAGNPAYSIIEYPSIATATVDGKWTSGDEWTDAPATDMAGNAAGKFGYNVQDFTNLGLEWIIEIFTDNTNDAGDYWQICLDDSNSNTAAPDTGDFMIEITGHTTLKVYQGTGSGWSLVTPAAGELIWSNTISTSPWSSTPHWILEIVDSSKIAGTVLVPNAPPTGMRVAAYDASSNTIAAWAPGSSANVPNTWGLISTFSLTPIPEGFSLVGMMLLSSVAVAFGFYFERKRQKSKVTAQ